LPCLWEKALARAPTCAPSCAITTSRSSAGPNPPRAARVGWLVKLDLELEGGQSLVAEMPKERFDALAVSEGDRVRVSLGEAAVFVEDYVI
jgi:hypothetical protein